MGNLADYIEQYLKAMLKDSGKGAIEIQRAEIAEKFNCVPSQINYVLSTRFTIERGYLVESRRGGGGYVRIVRLSLPEDEKLENFINQTIGDMIDQDTAEGLIYRLHEEGLITEREARIMSAALDRNTIYVELPERDQLRALIFKAMLMVVLRKDF